MSLETPRHRYQQVADHIRAAIGSGEYRPGSKLPSQPKLAEEFGITQRTVGNAIAVLRREGLVRVVDNVGAYVREVPPIPRFANKRYTTSSREADGARGAFDSELRERGHETTTSLVQHGRVEAPEHAARALGLEEGAPVAIRKRHMLADETPVQVATSYIPWDLAEGTAILEEDTGPGGTYSRLAEKGHGPARFTEAIRIRTVTPDEADFLKSDPEQQVFEILHTAWDENDRAVEICVHVMPTYQWELHYEWPAN
ncbi:MULTISPECIES: GntR family transcriptional regulator [Nocardiopsis]|uniref:GntR family transcriptional regulator n=1 Tax=Nocardiopsis TaxID=2013 RepID=UPI0003757055|nr:GntR family transcriptional regulator [Nocardiopsis sp. CNS-639]